MVLKNPDIKADNFNKNKGEFSSLLDNEFQKNLKHLQKIVKKYKPKNMEELQDMMFNSNGKFFINKNPDILVFLGMAYLMVDEKEKGMKILNRAKNLAPKDKLVSEQLAKAYLFSGDVGNAITEMEKLDVTKNDNKSIQYPSRITNIT